MKKVNKKSKIAEIDLEAYTRFMVMQINPKLQTKIFKVIDIVLQGKKPTPKQLEDSEMAVKEVDVIIKHLSKLEKTRIAKTFKLLMHVKHQRDK